MPLRPLWQLSREADSPLVKAKKYKHFIFLVEEAIIDLISENPSAIHSSFGVSINFKDCYLMSIKDIKTYIEILNFGLKHPNPIDRIKEILYEIPQCLDGFPGELTYQSISDIGKLSSEISDSQIILYFKF